MVLALRSVYTMSLHFWVNPFVLLLFRVHVLKHPAHAMNQSTCFTEAAQQMMKRELGFA